MQVCVERGGDLPMPVLRACPGLGSAVNVKLLLSTRSLLTKGWLVLARVV